MSKEEEEIDQLEAFFNTLPKPLPQNIILGPGEKIIKAQQFIDNHVLCLRANIGRPILYNPYISRLRRLREYFENSVAKEAK